MRISDIFQKENRTLAVILAASFLLSIAYAFYYKIDPAVDARAYDNIAVNIVSGAGYKEIASSDFQRDFAQGRVGPLYEYFLAGVYSVLGHSYPAVWIFQALLHALSALLIYRIALLLFAESEAREKAALWAAALFGFYPDLIEISAMLMTETLYIFLLCLMLYVFVRLFTRKDYAILSLLGAVSGLAVLARPPVLFCLPVIYWYLYQKKIWRGAAIFSFVLFLTFVPWTARNYLVYGRIMPFGVAGQYNFWIGNHPGSIGEQVASPEIFDFIATHPIVALGDESMRQFKNFVITQPWTFAGITLLRINRYFSILRPMGFWFYVSGWRQMLFVASSVIGSVVLFILGFAGIFKMAEEKKESYGYMLGFAALTPLILFVTVVETRYRFQIYPLLALFAGYFIAAFDLRNQRMEKMLSAAAAVILVNGGIDLLLNSGRVFEKMSGWLR